MAARQFSVKKRFVLSLTIAAIYCIAIQVIFTVYFSYYSKRDRNAKSEAFRENFPQFFHLHPPQNPGDKTAEELLNVCPVLSPQKTKLHILTPRERIVQGNYIKLRLETFSEEGAGPMCGGDFFYAVMYYRKLVESVDYTGETSYIYANFTSTVGHISDHRNGTYTITFFAGWSGFAMIRVMLVHPLMVIRTLSNHYQPREKRLFWTGVFSQDASSEEFDSFSAEDPRFASSFCYLVTHKSVLNSQQDNDKTRQCVYHHHQLGSRTRIVCNKPVGTPCKNLETIMFYGDYGFNYMAMSSLYTFYNELLEVKKSMQLPYSIFQGNFSNIPVGYKYIRILEGLEDKEESKTLNKIPENRTLLGDVAPQISGYWSSLTRWESLEQANHHWSLSTTRNCLRGRDIYLFGDSTTRQWFYHLATTEVTSDLRPVEVDANLVPANKFEANAYSVAGKWYHLNTHGRGINLTYFLHPWARGGPRSFRRLPGEYTASLIDGLPHNRCNYVVVVSLWAHFTVLPEELFVDRLVKIRSALKRLLRDCPRARVVIKGSHNVGIDIDAHRLHWSDWLYYNMNTVMRRVFAGMKVHFLNVWDLNLAYSYLHGQTSVHMPQVVIGQEVSLFLSSICTPD